MRVETITNNGITQLLLTATGEKDIAVLTELFDMRGAKDALRQRARVKEVIRTNGAVSAVTIDNDAYITHNYLETMGFTTVTNVVYREGEGFFLGGYYFVKDRYVIYNKLNSNVYRVYKNAKLKSFLHYVEQNDIRPNDRLGGLVIDIDGVKYLAEQSVVQVDTSKKAVKAYKIKRESELKELIRIYKD